MTRPLLSICIPTFNRAPLLQRSLAALAKQVAAEGLNGQVEVCVSDNCSPDATQSVIANAILDAPHIRWNTWRNAENIGGVQNILRVADAASGEYLSVTGDDDTLRPHVLASLLTAAASGDVLVVVNSYAGQGKWVRGLRASDGTQRYFRSFQEMNLHLGLFHTSFLGNLVFRRDVFLKYWREVQLTNAYPHTWIAALAMVEGPALFTNIKLYDVDCSHRLWWRRQPRFTCRDMAEVQTAAGMVGGSWRDVVSTYSQLSRSIPRAVLHGRKDVKDGVRPKELWAAYRRLWLFQGLTVGLWALASACPTSLLARLLRAVEDRNDKA